MSRFQRGFAIIAALSAVLVGLACSLGNFTLNLGGEETATPPGAIETTTGLILTQVSQMTKPAPAAAQLPSAVPTTGFSQTAQPTSARSLLLDLPIPSNATERGTLGDILTFTSPDAPKIVGDFYRGSLPGQGWTLVNDSSLDTLVMMTIQQNSRIYSIMIAPGAINKGSSVVVTRAP